MWTAAPSTAAVAATPGPAPRTPGPAPHTPGPAPRTPVPALEDNGQGDDGTLSDDGGESHAIDNTAEFAQTSWPTDTDIVFPSGSAKMSLTNQTVMVKFVLHDAMEVVRADLLFKVAFPDPTVAIELVKESLITSASRLRGAGNIYRRLLFDDWYMSKMITLVSSRDLEMMTLTLLTAACPDSTFPK